MIEAPGTKGEASMEFLYRRPDQGETGPGAEGVRVEDRPAATFVCLGLQGRMDEARLREGVARLRGWLGEHRAEWSADGPPRQLGYHGPDTPVGRQLWGVQIPVRPASDKGDR